MKRGRRGEAKQMGRVMLANETKRAELRCCWERGGDSAEPENGMAFLPLRGMAWM